MSLDKHFKDRKGADLLNKELQQQLVIFPRRFILDNYSFKEILQLSKKYTVIFMFAILKGFFA